MGDIVIHFSYNPQTGEQELIVDYESEEDLTKVEHEQRHRDILEKLIGKGMIDVDQIKRIRMQSAGKEVAKIPAQPLQKKDEERLSFVK